MNCLTCGHKNPMTGGYCQKCGAKLDMTADEIRSSLVEKARGEAVQSAGVHARQSLTFAVVILCVALTFLVLSGNAPEGGNHVPSSGAKAKYLEGAATATPELPKLLVPVEPRKKK